MLAGLLCATVCFGRGRGVGGLHYIWHIWDWKWFCALLTHRLKRLIDCGSWLTLERRQPASPGAFFFFFIPPLASEQVKREMYDLTWESWEVSGTYSTNTHQPLARRRESPRGFKTTLTCCDKRLQTTKRCLVLESLYRCSIPDSADQSKRTTFYLMKSCTLTAPDIT